MAALLDALISPSNYTTLDFDCQVIPFNNRKAMELLIERCYGDHKDDLIAFLNQQQSHQPSTWILTIILFLFGLLIFIGGCGNFLVIYVVATQKKMRTPRNVFIVNLAISDMSFCLVTQPFNLLKLFGGTSGWHLGDFMCKFTAIFQGTNIFVSTITITAIALDRFQVIVYPTRGQMQSRGAVLSVYGIWFIAVLLAGPTFFFTETASSVHEENVTMCREREMDSGKLIYSTFALVFQYIIPLITVAVAYSLISLRINHRMINRKASTVNSANDVKPSQKTRLFSHRSSEASEKQKLTTSSTNEHCSSIQQDNVISACQRRAMLEKRRQRRASILLFSIACVFAVSWLPLNINNIIMDLRSRTLSEDSQSMEMTETTAKTKNEDVIVSPEKIFIIHSLCLLTVLSSACLNPVLYGWLNENFRSEFMKVFSRCKIYFTRCCCCCQQPPDCHQQNAAQELLVTKPSRFGEEYEQLRSSFPITVV